MAKRTIIECDLTKQEYDPDETVTITFKQKNKARARSYDLSPEAAAKLEQQLVGGPKLTGEWGFFAQPAASQGRGSRPARTVGDLDTDAVSAERTIADKKAELREAGVIPANVENKPQEAEVSEVTEIVGGKKDCLHMNKGRIQTTLRDGKRFIFRLCTECRARIPEMPLATKAAYLDGKVNKADDVNIREL
jgi:hypothetical protein